jgi:hypothetical protein
MYILKSHNAANYIHVLCEQLASEHDADMREHCHKFWSYNNLSIT